MTEHAGDVAEQVTSAVSRKLVGWLAGIAAAGVIALVGSSIAFYATVSADAARYGELHAAMRQDIGELDSRVDRQEQAQTAMRASFAALETKMDTMQAALTRIQNLLDERLPPRGRR